MDTGDDGVATPDVTEDDAVRGVVTPSSRISDSPDGRMLSHVLQSMNAWGDDAEDTYRAALEEARDHASGVVVEIARSFGCATEDDQALRWQLVHTAAELRHPAALPFLRSVALTPIPQERSPDPHASTVEDETILRTTAVDGIAALTPECGEDAEQVLFSCVESPSFSVRRAAVQGLITSPRGDDLRDEIAACLPKEQQFLINLKRVQVQDVEQITQPYRYLSETAQQREADKPPTFDEPDQDQERGDPKAKSSEQHRES